MANKITNKFAIDEIKSRITYLFLHVADSDECALLCNAIVNDVIKDIEETADIDFNMSDVDMAITRVLKKRLGIEE